MFFSSEVICRLEPGLGASTRLRAGRQVGCGGFGRGFCPKRTICIVPVWLPRSAWIRMLPLCRGRIKGAQVGVRTSTLHPSYSRCQLRTPLRQQGVVGLDCVLRHSLRAWGIHGVCKGGEDTGLLAFLAPPEAFPNMTDPTRCTLNNFQGASFATDFSGLRSCGGGGGPGPEPAKALPKPCEAALPQLWPL